MGFSDSERVLLVIKVAFPISAGLASLGSLSEGLSSITTCGSSGSSLTESLGVNFGSNLLVTFSNLSPSVFVLTVSGFTPVVLSPLLIGVEAGTSGGTLGSRGLRLGALRSSERCRVAVSVRLSLGLGVNLGVGGFILAPLAEMLRRFGIFMFAMGVFVLTRIVAVVVLVRLAHTSIRFGLVIRAAVIIVTVLMFRLMFRLVVRFVVRLMVRFRSRLDSDDMIDIDDRLNIDDRLSFIELSFSTNNSGLLLFLTVTFFSGLLQLLVEILSLFFPDQSRISCEPVSIPWLHSRAWQTQGSSWERLNVPFRACDHFLPSFHRDDDPRSVYGGHLPSWSGRSSWSDHLSWSDRSS